MNSNTNPKIQFIYGLFSFSVVGSCLAFFMLIMNIVAFYLPLGVDNAYFRNKSPYQICNNLDANDYQKPATLDTQECIKILTKEDEETARQTRITNLTASSLGLSIALILGFFSYKAVKNLPDDTQTIA